VRTAILILMIALLPLRMWAADDMAIRMAAQSDSALAVLAGEPMPPDCPMGAQADDHDQGDSSSHCVACHLCAASALYQQARIEQVWALAALPREGPSRFASAVPRLDHRPPIS